MNVITLEEVIHAPPERVFEVFADLRRAAERISGITRLEVLTEGPIEKGTRWREARMMFGREEVQEMWISDFDPPRSYSVEAEAHGARYLTCFDFMPEGAGTRVTMAFRCEGQTFFAKLMIRLFFKAMAKNFCTLLKKDMVDLKQVCEAA